MISPSPYPVNPDPSKIKAIILGCDPTAFDKAKKQIPLKTVFGIGQDNRYFAGIKANLALLKISMDEIYVQNLIPKYRQVESSKDPDWVGTAQLHIPDRVKEFDEIDPSRTIPVFLTSELLYKAILNPEQRLLKPKEIFDSTNEVVLPSTTNKLFRPIIILYRHPKYSLKKQHSYTSLLLKQLTSIKFK